LHIIPKEFLTNSIGGTITVLAIIIPVFIYGNRHYYDKHRQTLELTTSKPLSHTYKLVMLSDLHLGYHNQHNELSRWIDIIAAEKPDLVLIAGDIIDRSMRPLTEQDMAAEFRRLNVPVYACLGNHEYYSGKPEAQQFIATTGIKLLSDTSQTVNNDITIVGRDDRTNRRRIFLKTILTTADTTRYTIVLDHQPNDYAEEAESKMDLVLSGHTHGGQFWGLGNYGVWIGANDAYYGYERRKNTDFIVSSGIGDWAIDFKTGCISEYIVVNIKGK
jgi:predicted MPP superfamily phosphohydrolase